MAREWLLRSDPMKTSCRIEILESRIAPATLTGNILTYTDADGKVSKPSPPYQINLEDFFAMK